MDGWEGCSSRVGEDDVGSERVDEDERRLSAVGDLHVVAVALQQRLQNEADVLFVIDDKDAAHARRLPRATKKLQS